MEEELADSEEERGQLPVVANTRGETQEKKTKLQSSREKTAKAQT